MTPSLDGDPVRCRVSSRSLLGDADRERIVGLLVRARLVTSEEDTFELAHEALARAWPRLQSWLDDDVAGQRLLRHLTTAAEGWESLGRPVSELYRGARLDTALEWQEASAPHLTELEQQFLADSVEQASSETRAIAERARRDARQNRRLRSLLGATAILLVASMVVGYVAIRQREQATSERQVATARELAAAANANVTIDRRAQRPARPRRRRRVPFGGRRARCPRPKRHCTARSRPIAIELRVPGVGGALDWSPDGRLFVTEGPQSSGIVDIRDARTGASVRSFHGHDLDVTDVAFNHDGTLLATTGADGRPGSGTRPPGRNCTRSNIPTVSAAWGPSFSQDGAYFAAAWPDDHGGVVRVLDLESGRVHEIDRVPAPIATSFDPGAARLAVASNQEPIAVVLDVESGDELFTATGHFAALRDVAWSPDGSTIATAADDGSARLFDAATGQQRAALLGHVAASARSIGAPSPAESSRPVPTARPRVWSLIEGAGRELFSLSAHDQRDEILGVAFSPDGTRVMTGDAGITATIIWNVGATGGAEVANLPGPGVLPRRRGLQCRWSAPPRDERGRCDPGLGSGDVVHCADIRGAGDHRDAIVAARRAHRLLRTTSRYWPWTPAGGSSLVARGRRETGSRPVEVWDLETGRRAFTVPRGGLPRSGLEPRWSAPRHPRRDGVGDASSTDRVTRSPTCACPIWL